MTPTRTKACVACRDGKRKCDRLLPACSLCSRLGRRCQYGFGLSIPSHENKSSRINRLNKLDVPQSDPSLSHSLFEQKRIDELIFESVLRIVGDVAAVRKVAAKYFESIHLWFPIILEDKYYGQPCLTLEEPCAEYNLLSLSMALIITLPSEKEMMRKLYMLVKTSIAAVEAASLNTLAVVQSRLLLALFEFGHGLSAAFISIAATARAAVDLGLNQTTNTSRGEGFNNSAELGERHHVWWGIVMLDRIHTLERGEGPCATQGVGSPRHLPRDIGSLDQRILSSATPLPLSTPSTVRVGPFARQAQVSHVLDILLMNLCDEKALSSSKKEELDQIARTLTAFSLLLPEETPQPWPRYCGAIGMCYTALMTLHLNKQHSISTVEIGDSNSAESVASALDRLKYISMRFNNNIHEVEVDALSPFPPCGLSKAASIQLSLWKETGDSKYQDAINGLTVMLKHFSRRWGNAGKLLDSLSKGVN